MNREIWISYKNWKGNERQRPVVPIAIWFGDTEYHPQQQWFLRAHDTEFFKEGFEARDYPRKDFALKDMKGWTF